LTVPADPTFADSSTQRESARTRGRTIFASPPWDEVADRAALLLSDPPADLEVEATPGYWIVVERDVSRSLPADFAQPLFRGEPVIRALDLDGAHTARLEVLTRESAQRLVEGVSRNSIEARWRIRHAEPIVDRLRLQEQLASAAAQLPVGAPNRVTRTLWLEAHAGLRALSEANGRPLLVAAGETRGALERLACFLDVGAYPPARYLAAAAASTALGQRLGDWFAGLGDAVGGDEAAARRTTGSIDQVRKEVHAVVRLSVGTHDWLADPDPFWLRAR